MGIHNENKSAVRLSPSEGRGSSNPCIFCFALVARECMAERLWVVTVWEGALSVVAKAEGSRITQPRFKFRFYHWVAVHLWAVYSSSLSLHFFICEMVYHTVLWKVNGKVEAKCWQDSHLEAIVLFSSSKFGVWKASILLRQRTLLCFMFKYLLLCHALHKPFRCFQKIITF